MTQDFHRGCWLIEKPEAAMKAIIRNLESSILRDSMKKSGMLSLIDVQAHDQWYCPTNSQAHHHSQAVMAYQMVT
ncbi:hypothetical protein A3N63_10265 [Klebsiella aerogenes]|nr:hypothetical protein A3N63_10265 [Klebsiella aerogenes]